MDEKEKIKNIGKMHIKMGGVRRESHFFLYVSDWFLIPNIKFEDRKI